MTYESPFAIKPTWRENLTSRGYRVRNLGREWAYRGSLSSCCDEIRRSATLLPPSSDYTICEEFVDPRFGETYHKELSDKDIEYVERWFYQAQLPPPLTSPRARPGDPPKPRKAKTETAPAAKVADEDDHTED